MPVQTTFAGAVSRKEAGAADRDIMTATLASPVTKTLPIPDNLDQIIARPGVARAAECPSIEFPNGALDAKKHVGTPMMQHVEFFDRNNDGVITPLETFQGFRIIGFNFFFCLAAVMVIHSGFAYPTQNSYIPDPRFYITVKNIHNGKHGSDMGAYDTEGRFIPQKMEEIFSKFDTGKKGYLTFKDIITATESVRNVNDFFGWFAAKFEWITLYLLCQENGKISREDVRSCYDGTLFYRIEKRRAALASQQ